MRNKSEPAKVYDITKVLNDPDYEPKSLWEKCRKERFLNPLKYRQQRQDKKSKRINRYL